MTDESLIEIDDLEKHFVEQGVLDSLLGHKPKRVQAVDGITLDVHRTDSIGIIGESGCGKTTLLRTLVGLYKPTGGTISYRGTPLSEFDKGDWKDYRKKVQIIFQDPFNSLDPKFTVREIVAEPLKIHGMSGVEERVREVLEQVELRPADTYLNSYPDQLSGGEKQRVSIARALSVEPDVLLADEPMSMLDVSTQASLLDLLSTLVNETGIALIYISHDLSTVSYVCDMINVMYMGRVIEEAPTESLIREPKHPYSQALINAVPIPDPHYERERTVVQGAIQNPVNIGEGCRFRDRCPERMDVCEYTPRYVDADEGARSVACHLYYDHFEEGVSASAGEEMARTTIEEEQ